MPKSFATIAAALTISTPVFAASLASAQPPPAQAPQPRITNVRLVSHVAAPLDQTFRSLVASQVEPAWIGYFVPVVRGDRVMCCFNSDTASIDGNIGRSNGQACCGACALEPSAAPAGISRSEQPQAGGPVKLEGADQMIVLFRVAGRQIDRVRVFSEACALDGGGRSLMWLAGVRPAESVALLESLVTTRPEPRDHVADGAIAAIALHQDAAADAALERLLRPDRPQSVRAKVPFWLGNTRGRRGLEVLQRIITDDPSVDVKKKAVFGISQSGEAEAVDILIQTARTNANTAIRGDAIFWLAQKAGTKAASAITERIEHDPDTDVKKRAVFALSRLPRDEGVPLLIQVGRTHSNPVVRKQAIFWLGQSKDPRALEFFAEILK